MCGGTRVHMYTSMRAHHCRKYGFVHVVQASRCARVSVHCADVPVSVPVCRCASVQMCQSECTLCRCTSECASVQCASVQMCQREYADVPM